MFNSFRATDRSKAFSRDAITPKAHWEDSVSILSDKLNKSNAAAGDELLYVKTVNELLEFLLPQLSKSDAA